MASDTRVVLVQIVTLGFVNDSGLGWLECREAVLGIVLYRSFCFCSRAVIWAAWVLRSKEHFWFVAHDLLVLTAIRCRRPLFSRPFLSMCPFVVILR